MSFQFRVLGGNHIGKDGKQYNMGDVFTSETDLREQFVNKFELIQEAVAGPAKPVDVSSAFPLAGEVFHKVFAVDGGFNVADETTPDVPINPNGPATAEQVNAYLSDQLTEMQRKSKPESQQAPAVPGSDGAKV